MGAAVKGTGPETETRDQGLTLRCLRIGEELAGAISNLRQVTGEEEGPIGIDGFAPCGTIGLLAQQIKSLQDQATTISVLVVDIQQRL